MNRPVIKITNSKKVDNTDIFSKIESAISLNGEKVATCLERKKHPMDRSLYVFTNNGGNWRPETILKPDPGDGKLTNFGDIIKISNNGNTIAVSEYSENNIYIFVKYGDAWGQDYKVNISDIPGGLYFHGNIGMTESGDRLVFTAMVDSGQGLVNKIITLDKYTKKQNRAYKYTWILEVGIEPEDDLIKTTFGSYIDFSLNGSTLAVYGGIKSTGTEAVLIYRRRKRVWYREHLIKNEDPENCINFGKSISMDAIGSKLIIQGKDRRSNKLTNSSIVYVYEKYKDSWEFNTKIKVFTLPDTCGVVNGDSSKVTIILDRLRCKYNEFNLMLSDSIAINPKGDKIAIGAYGKNEPGDGLYAPDIENSGVVYILKKTWSGEWVQDTTLLPDKVLRNEMFGSSLSISRNNRLLITDRLDTTEPTKGVKDLFYMVDLNQLGD